MLIRSLVEADISSGANSVVLALTLGRVHAGVGHDGACGTIPVLLLSSRNGCLRRRVQLSMKEINDDTGMVKSLEVPGLVVGRFPEYMLPPIKVFGSSRQRSSTDATLGHSFNRSASFRRSCVGRADARKGTCRVRECYQKHNCGDATFRACPVNDMYSESMETVIRAKRVPFDGQRYMSSNAACLSSFFVACIAKMNQ